MKSNLLRKHIKSFKCIACDADIEISGHGLHCTGCGRHYGCEDGPASFIRAGLASPAPDIGIIVFLTGIAKKFPVFRDVFRYGLSPVMVSGKGRRDFVDMFNKDSLILNIGSGPQSRYEGTLNIDMYPYARVDALADITSLPLKDGVVDGIINEVVLEHIGDIEKVLSESYRVLKKGGMVYVVVPFIQGYHSSPYDYLRWTLEGTEKMLERFEKVELGLRAGPTSGFLWIFQEWLAMLLSLNIKPLYEILLGVLTVLTAPLKLLDILMVRHSQAHKIASGFYFIGMKK